KPLRHPWQRPFPGFASESVGKAEGRIQHGRLNSNRIHVLLPKRRRCRLNAAAPISSIAGPGREEKLPCIKRRLEILLDLVEVFANMAVGVDQTEVTHRFLLE